MIGVIHWFDISLPGNAANPIAVELLITAHRTRNLARASGLVPGSRLASGKLVGSGPMAREAAVANIWRPGAQMARRLAHGLTPFLDASPNATWGQLPAQGRKSCPLSE